MLVLCSRGFPDVSLLILDCPRSKYFCNLSFSICCLKSWVGSALSDIFKFRDWSLSLQMHWIGFTVCWEKKNKTELIFLHLRKKGIKCKFIFSLEDSFNHKELPNLHWPLLIPEWLWVHVYKGKRKTLGSSFYTSYAMTVEHPFNSKFRGNLS